MLRRAASTSELRRLHRGLRGGVSGSRRLEGVYVTESDLARGDYDQRYPSIEWGILQPGRVGPTARRVLRDHGVVLTGPSPGDLVPAIPSEALRTEMAFNLNRYWAPKVRRRLPMFVFNVPVDFAVLTIPRILHTLETGGIISKRAAADYLDSRFPEWKPLVDDVRSRFSSAPPATRMNRITRALETRRFVLEMVDYANAQHGLGRAP